ncbi:MAG: hypothetical protein EOL97_12075 [Spirochaetia bacterium]|nr:hypothetical protein [Spirochaetia bacterium]
MSKKSLNLYLGVLITLIIAILISCDLFITPPAEIITTPQIKGNVSIPEGSNLNYSDIWVKETTSNKITQVKEDGTFLISGLSENKKYTLYFSDTVPSTVSKSAKAITGSHFGAQITDVVASLDNAQSLETVPLKKTGYINGKVTLKDDNDNNLDNVGIDVYVPGTSFIAKTDEEGNFSISNVPQGKYILRMEKNSYEGIYSEELILLSETEEDPILNVSEYILKKETGSISGKAQSVNAIDNAGTNIKLSNETNSYVGLTSSDSTFEIYNILPGTYTLLITRNNYLSATVENIIINGGKETVLEDTISIKKIAGSLSGLVTDDNSTACSNVQVVATSNSNEKYLTYTVSDGTYFIKELLPDTYSIEYSKDGYVSKTINNIKVEYNKESTLPPIKLTNDSCVISGKVFLTGETTYEDVQVIATSTSNNNLKFQTFSLDDGSYILSNIPEGQFTISYYKDGFNSNTSTLVNTTLGQIINLDNLTLTSTSSTVSGNVILDSAYSHEGINILLKADDASIQYSTTTDTAGDYIFNKVEAGVYTLFASKDGYNLKENTQITIEPATDISLDSIKLDVAIRSVIGNVNLELSEDNAGALVTATNLSDTSLIYSAITNTDGNFTLAGMKPGEYRISITYSGYRTTTLPTINIVNNTLNDIGTADLVIARGRIEGIATLEGETSYEGTTVELVGTEYSTITDEDGIYSFSVPSKNYPGGVRYSREDYKTESEIETISVLTDSTYSVRSIELICEKSTIKGLVNVSATDDNSNVTVSIKNTAYTLITDINGEYEFNHIPLGQYTLVFERENTPTVEKQITLTPGFELIVDEIIMIPNSASVIGTISLDSVADYSNVKVTATTAGTNNVYTTYSNASGYFKVSNLISTGTHTITFTKEGWDSEELIVSNLAPLEEKNITIENPITLYDTTKPIINSITINEGGNTTSDSTVSIKIDAIEQGSGIKKMKISWDGIFDSESWITYESIFDSIIPNTSNGDKTVYIKIADFSNNEVDTTASATITLTDQYTSYSGMLEDNELTWTKALSPILISGDVIVPLDKTLIIEPGVDVQFNGSYAISIRGNLSAIGTESEPIVFKSATDRGYTGTWNGITAGSNVLSVNEDKYEFILEEGSTIQYSRIINTSNGIRGNILLKNSYIKTDNYALGSKDGDSFTGYAINNEIFGSVKVQKCSNILFGNIFKGNIFSSTFYRRGTRLVNNSIQDYNTLILRGHGKFEFNTLNNITNLRFENCGDIKSTPMGNEIINIKNTINNIEQNSSLRDMNFSNIYDNLGSPMLSIITPWSTLRSHNWRNNYWGENYTIELNSLKNNNKNNASFIYDGNDNPDLSIIDFSGFVSKPWDFAGYHGAGFIDFEPKFISYSSINSNVKDAHIGDPIEFTLSMLSKGNVEKYKVTQSVENIQNTLWQNYSGSGYINTVDNTLLRDGWLDLFIQVMDSDGNISAIKTLSVGYDCPIIDEVSIKEDDKFTTDEQIDVKFKITDNGYPYNKFEIFLNKELLRSGTYYGNDTFSIIYPTNKKNGNYILEIIGTDSVGNSTSTGEINFIIERPLPELIDISLQEGTFIEEGQSVELSLEIVRTKHLKTINIISNGNTAFSKTYSDNGENSIKLNTTIDSVYLPNGDNELIIELIDYAGNISTSVPISFKVGGTAIAPEVTGFTIEEGTVFNTNDDFSLNLTATDDGGIKSILVTLGDYIIQSSSWPKYSEALQTRSVESKLMIPYRKNGNYVLKVEVSDFAGNTTTLSKNITIDRPIPIPTLNITKLDDSLSINWNITNYSYLKHYQILIDGNQLYFEMPNYKGSNSCYINRNKSWELKNLPIGTHDLIIKAIDQAGNVNSSESVSINIEGQLNSSEFGLNKTWSNDGTLLEDWSTLYLWNFDDPIKPNWETVSESRIGTIYQTTSGVGNNAARISVQVENEISFSDSTWTFEFWSKLENPDPNSNLYVYITNLLNSCLRKYSSSSNSYWYNTYYSLSLLDNEISNNSEAVGQSSRDYYQNWHHYAVVSTGNEINWYIDGVLINQVVDTVSKKSASGISIYSNYLDNFVDEIRISCTARSGEELWNYVKFVQDNNLLPEN